MRSKKSAQLRMDNVGIVVEDLKAAVAFFVELGLELEGETTVEGKLIDRLVGLDGVRSDIVMMRTPDGHSRLELSKFQKPKAINPEPNAPLNRLGTHRIMFAVTDIDGVVARLQKHGAELCWRGGAVRGHVPTLLSAWPRRYYGRAGRTTR